MREKNIMIALMLGGAVAGFFIGGMLKLVIDDPFPPKASPVPADEVNGVPIQSAFALYDKSGVSILRVNVPELSTGFYIYDLPDGYRIAFAKKFYDLPSSVFPLLPPMQPHLSERATLLSGKSPSGKPTPIQTDEDGYVIVKGESK